MSTRNTNAGENAALLTGCLRKADREIGVSPFRKRHIACEDPTPSALLVPESRHRIDSRGPPGGKVARHKGDHEQRGRSHRHDDRIGGLGLV